MGLDRRAKIYKIGSTYYADKHDGTMISASGTFETVLQAAIDANDPLGGGTISIDQIGNFYFSASFTTINMRHHTWLVIGPQTTLYPPDAFTGHVFTFNGTNQAYISGGHISKATPAKNWKGILFTSTGDGTVWCGVYGTTINKPYSGIRFLTSGTGWIKDNDFRNVIVDKPLIGIEFGGNGTGVMHTGYPNVGRTLFDKCTIQDDTIDDLAIGFSNVSGNDITFRDCNVWDLSVPATQKTMTINTAAGYIRINGGIITNGPYFVNDCANRSVFIESDEYNGPRYGNESLTQTSFVSHGRRKGGWIPSAAGWGIVGSAWTLNGAGTMASTSTATFADGTASKRFTAAAAVATDGFGIRYTNPMTCRGWNPIYKAKFRINSTGGRRSGFGLVGSTTAEITADDNLVGIAGIMLGTRTADTTWGILHNDASGGQARTDTGVTIDTSIVTIELAATDAETTKWKYSLNGAPWAAIATTTNIPQQTDALVPYAAMANGSATQKNFDLFEVYVETN